MVKYQLDLTINQKWVDYFNKNPDSNWKFCFARKSQSVGSDTTFNVVAYSETISNKVRVKWEDKYSMAGGKTGFSAGATISVTTSDKSIEYGEGFYLKDWATTSIKKGGGAPKNGFLFHTVPQAAAILYQEIAGVATPVYITPEDILPPNTTEVLVPKLEVAVWFQKKVETGTMIDSAITDAFTIPMETAKVNAGYDAAGSWSITQAPVFYGLPADIAALEISSDRIFIGKITYDKEPPTKDQIQDIVDGITTELQKFDANPPFGYIDSQGQDEALLVRFGEHDAPNTPLELAQSAWNAAYNGLAQNLKDLVGNGGAVLET